MGEALQRLKSGAIKINQAQVSHRDLENPGITSGYANRDFGKSPPQMWGKARRNRSRLNAREKGGDEERKRAQTMESRGDGGKKGENAQAGCCTCSQNVLAKAHGSSLCAQYPPSGCASRGGEKIAHEGVIFLIPSEPCAQKYARMVAISRAPGEKKENIECPPPRK